VVTATDTQTPATWGLDRIDQRNLPLSNSYTYPTGASNVTAYIIDTGMRLTHSQFSGRAVSGYDAVDGGSADDCNGHGTHVAGTVGSTTYGVAKLVRLVAVRVLDCSGSGTTSGVVAGIDWVTAHHMAGRPAVANMSLGGGVSSALDTAVANSIADGITYAVAAGNSNANACNSSPSRVAAAITVGATTNADARASYSNYGTCLDLFAPGSSVTSAWFTSDTATNTISGTSMAAPHAAGAAALYLAANPTATPSAVRDALVNAATTGIVTNPGTGSPNRLLYTVDGGTSAPPPPPSTSPCASLPMQYTGTLSGTGASQYQPGGTYYYSSVSGTHRGCLDGPAGVDFDLYLQKWNGSTWVNVAQSISTTPDESITYSGTPGYYMWKVLSYSGSGSYTFGMQTA
jgi:subtilisin family serine protease